MMMNLASINELFCRFIKEPQHNTTLKNKYQISVRPFVEFLLEINKFVILQRILKLQIELRMLGSAQRRSRRPEGRSVSLLNALLYILHIICAFMCFEGKDVSLSLKVSWSSLCQVDQRPAH